MAFTDINKFNNDSDFIYFSLNIDLLIVTFSASATLPNGLIINTYYSQ